MDKAKASFWGVIIALLLSTTGVIATEKGPADIVLRSTVDPASKPKLAFFPHALHQVSYACAVCHHTKTDNDQQQAYSEGMQIQKCESCHNKTAGIAPKLNTFKKAAHERCRGCHKSMAKERKKAGPTKCNGCHRKELK